MTWRNQEECDSILYWYRQASTIELEELFQLHPELTDLILKVRSIAHWEQEIPPTYTDNKTKDHVLLIIRDNPKWLATFQRI